LDRRVETRNGSLRHAGDGFRNKSAFLDRFGSNIGREGGWEIGWAGVQVVVGWSRVRVWETRRERVCEEKKIGRGREMGREEGEEPGEVEEAKKKKKN
jgi:hypothetical protein